MNTLKKIFSFSNATLLVALALSSIAAWYSIVGLTAIFAGAVTPIIIMGSALEFGKVVTTVWLRKYWHRCALIMKLYLVPAVFLLAVITSMGIFGFLSKAHMDQGIASGDSVAKLALYDEKIKTERDNIASAKEALAQMDAQVNNIMSKGDSEHSVERSVQIRKQQAKERVSLQKDIEVANNNIAKLNEERAPIAAENRKAEAEVGPIKYIAALIYGDNPDQNILERAVRWVIILLVAVFDPLALMLVIAANQSKDWDDDIDEELKLKEKVEHEKVMADLKIEEANIEQPNVVDISEKIEESEHAEDPHTIGWMYEGAPHGTNREVEAEPEESILDKHPYLNKPFAHFTGMTPMVSTKDEPLIKPLEGEEAAQLMEELGIVKDGKLTPEYGGEEVPEIVDITPKKDENSPPFEGVKVGDEWVQTGPAFLDHPNVQTSTDVDYVLYNGKRMSVEALKGLHPELFIKPDLPRDPSVNFGNTFPTQQVEKGDTFVRTDAIPNKVFKHNGSQWIETNKEVTDTYLTSDKYLNFLVEKISTGEYDPELLTETERDAIEQHIKKR